MFGKKTQMKRNMTPASSPFRFKSEWERLAWNHRFSAHDTLVLQYLIFMANTGDGDNCYPSVRRISAYTRLSERAVQRSLSSLEAQRVIVRNKRIGYTNLYEFCDPSGFTTELVEFDARRYPGHMTRPAADGGCQPDTPDCVAWEGCHTVTGGVTDSRRGGDSQSPYHDHIPTSETKIRDQEAAVTHARPRERAREASQPAAPKGQDLNLDHEQQGQAAASAEPAPASTVRAGAELEDWFSGQLKERRASLVVTPELVKPSQVKACLAAILRHAAGDEAQARAYLTERMDAYEMRGDARPRSCKALLGFLADRGDFATWERERHELLTRPHDTRPLWQQRGDSRGQLTGHVHSPMWQAAMDSGFLKD